MRWRKLGRVFEVNDRSDLMRSYARIPIADHIEGSRFNIYFGSRDESNREHVFRVVFDMQARSVIEIDEAPIIGYGEELGSFDDNGVTPCCVQDTDDGKYLYYAGWNIHVNIPFTNAIGIARSQDGGKTFEKMFKGPVLDRNINDHLFVAVNDVLFDEGVYKTWYLSCVKWVPQQDAGPLHYYHIRYAESEDGIHWDQTGEVAIDFKNEFEYAISTPRVIREESGRYSMWYSYRAQEDVETYRIGYAESDDGHHWVRKDQEAGIDVSDSGWDSEMICYPYVFDYDGSRYMLYNGNRYGETGFGLAVLE